MRADRPVSQKAGEESKEKKGSLDVPPDIELQLVYPGVLHVAKKNTILYAGISSLQSLLDRNMYEPKKIPKSIPTPNINVYYVHLEYEKKYESKVTDMKNSNEVQLKTMNPFILISSIKEKGNEVSANIQFVDTKFRSSPLYQVKITNPVVKRALTLCTEKDNGRKINSTDNNWSRVIAEWLAKYRRKYLYSDPIIVNLATEKHETILISSQLDAKNIDKFPIQCGYVRSQDKLFYVNKTKNECTELKLAADQLAEFDAKIKPRKQATTLLPEKLDEITSIRGGSSSSDNAMISHIFDEDTLVVAAPYLVEDKYSIYKKRGDYSPIYQVAILDIDPKKIHEIRPGDYSKGSRLILGFMFAKNLDIYQQLVPFEKNIFETLPSIKNIVQGALGNCFMLAAASAILKRDKGPEFIHGMMQQQKDQTVVRLFEPINCQPVYICVPNVTCNRNKSPISLHNAMWVHVLEHAYITFLFRYSKDEYLPSILSINRGGEVKNVVEALTGQKSKEKSISQDNSGALVEEITKLMSSKLADFKMTIAMLIRDKCELYCLLDKNENYFSELANYLNLVRNNGPENVVHRSKILLAVSALINHNNLNDLIQALDQIDKSKLSIDIIETLKRNLKEFATRITAGALGSGQYTKGQIKLHEELTRLHHLGYLLVTSTLEHFPKQAPIGLVNNHAYTITGIRNLGNCRGVVLKNPWSNTGRTYEARTWEPKATEQNEFWLELSDYTKFYSLCTAGRILTPELKSAIKEQKQDQKESVTYTGRLDRNEVKFNATEMNESQNVFTLLGTTNEEFVNTLLKCTEDRNSRKILAMEIEDALARKEFNVNFLWDAVSSFEDFSLFLEILELKQQLDQAKNDFAKIKDQVKKMLLSNGMEHKEDLNKIDHLINLLDKLKPADYQEDIHQLQKLQIQERLYNERLCDVDIYQAYVRAYQKDNKTCSVTPGCHGICLYGTQVNLGVYVWEKVKESQQVACMSAPFGHFSKDFHLLQIDSANHYNILMRLPSMEESLVKSSASKNTNSDRELKAVIASEQGAEQATSREQVSDIHTLPHPPADSRPQASVKIRRS